MAACGSDTAMICITYTFFFSLCLSAEATMLSLWVLLFMQLSGYPICSVCPWRLDFTIQKVEFGWKWKRIDLFHAEVWPDADTQSAAFGWEVSVPRPFYQFTTFSFKAINPLSWKLLQDTVKHLKLFPLKLFFRSPRQLKGRGSTWWRPSWVLEKDSWGFVKYTTYGFPQCVCPFQKTMAAEYLSMQHIRWAATQGAVAVIGTVWHSGPCADKAGDLWAPLVQQQQQWCHVSQWPFITRQAGCTAVPFAIWHRHAVLACDRCCTTVVPGVTNDLLDCLFPFFPVTKNYLFDDGHQCNPGPPWWTRRLLLLVFWDHIYHK